MPRRKTAAYGSWKSPITSSLIVSESIGLAAVTLSGDSVFWLEQRPREAGRSVVVRRDSAGVISDVTPAGFNVRTRVHEYGGGAFTVDADTVYFSNFADQRLYRQRLGGSPLGGSPEPISPAADVRFADYVVDRPRRRLISVCEDHTVPGPYPVNTISAIPVDGGAPQPLAVGSDFYSSPRLDADCSQLAWLSWNHPNMPWDGTELWLAPVRPDGALGVPVKVAGGDDESVLEPVWSPDGTLYFVSDRTGWWNIYRLVGGRVEPVCPMDAEFGAPQWSFGLSMFAFEGVDCILATYVDRGVWRLARIDVDSKSLRPLETPYTQVSSLSALGSRAVFIAGSPSQPMSVILFDSATGKREVVRSSIKVDVDPGYLSLPEPIEFPTENGLTAHAFFYSPANAAYTGPAGELPPLLVVSHGGPTSAAGVALNLSTQYFTSRGFAVVDVNYGGSTGYGREYRKRLNDSWGVVDVDDCANAARYLVKEGRVSASRLAIRGGSAGGYTTLCALTFRDVFHAGASWYGVSDAEALATDTHKFESRYLDRLIGPYPARRDLYVERSPIHFVERLSCPLIFFQGLEDKIVLPDQAQRMVDALRAKGVPVAYLAFEGEQHGFRKAANIKRALDAELYFYSRIFNFKPAGRIKPVPIDNLPGAP